MKRVISNKLIFVSLLSIFSVSSVLQNISGVEYIINDTYKQERKQPSFINDTSKETRNEYMAKELGLKFEYAAPWKLIPRDDLSKCEKEFCILSIKNFINDMTFVRIWIQTGQDFQEKCKCNSLLEFAQYDYMKYYYPLKNFSLINNNQTSIQNISAMQMEYIGMVNDIETHYLVNWIKNGDIFYKVIYQSDEDSFTKYLPSFKNILNSIVFFQTIDNKSQLSSEIKQESFINDTYKQERKQPSFINDTSKETRNEDTIKINATLKKGDFIDTNLHFQKTNLTFGEGSNICPDNNCIYEFQQTSFNEGFSVANSRYLSGTLKIEDKANSVGNFISYSYYKFSGSFDLVNSKENSKTGEKILIYEGDLGLDTDNEIFGTSEFEYESQINLYQPENRFELIGDVKS
jgi:hypothetical protein